MRASQLLAVGCVVAACLMMGTAVGEEVFATDLMLSGTGESAADPAPSSDCMPDCSCCDMGDLCCGPVWTFRAGALIMDRSTPDDRPLVTNSFRRGGTNLLDAGEFDFDFRGGWELSAIRHNIRCSCWDLEARYARIDGWQSTRDYVLSQTGSVVQYRTPLGNVAFPALVGGTYKSHFDSFELNLRRPIGCTGVTVLGGFRFAELDERGTTVFRVTDPGPTQNVATSQIGAINDLYGFQIGADATLWQWCCLSLDGKVRAGVYSNQAVSRVAHLQTGGPTWTARDEDTNTAFLGEVGLTGTCQLTDDLSLTAGYQVMWLSGVAVAGDQVASADPLAGTATVDTTGSPFYHGANVGLEYCW